MAFMKHTIQAKFDKKYLLIVHRKKMNKNRTFITRKTL